VLILNFSHPLTPGQVEDIERLIGEPVEEVRTVLVQIDPVATGGALSAQIAAVVDAAGLSSSEWQTRPIVINPPGLAAAATAIVADIHGRRGHFPAIIYLERVGGGFRVAEVADLQQVREQARRKR